MKEEMQTSEIIMKAWQQNSVVPAFNIPYIPMMEPVVQALKETKCFGLIAVARLEWENFGAISLRAIYEEYQLVKDEDFTRIHLDHVPVLDEDNQRVDYYEILSDAVEMGYQSIMVDGSRLDLAENIAATREVVKMAHAAGIAVEGELGAVLGHEQGPLPDYDTLYASGKGFTSANEAKQFVEQTEVDWLSVAVGNVHGAIAESTRSQQKIEARLNINHLKMLNEAVQIPLVLHGGTGIKKNYVTNAIQNGIAKINIGTAIRQPYERLIASSKSQARTAVYNKVVEIIKTELELINSVQKLFG